jgi:hypothetical protein
MIILKDNRDFFEITPEVQPDAIVFTSNGVVMKSRELVMGGGIALRFKQKYPWLPFMIGDSLVGLKGSFAVKRYGVFGPVPSGEGYDIFALQTKTHFKYDSVLEDVVENCEKLQKETSKYQKVLMTTPGCDLGGLDKGEVLEAISFLGDNFVVISRD